MQIILITLSYAKAANNLQIILTIRLMLIKMDEHILYFIVKKTDWQIPSASPYYYLPVQ